MINIANIPAILRQIIHQFKKETGLNRTDIEILTTLYTLCAENLFCTPQDLTKRLPTMSRDYIYDSLSKQKHLGYIAQTRKPLKYTCGRLQPGRPGLYACTEKGKELVQQFVQEMELLSERTVNGY